MGPITAPAIQALLEDFESASEVGTRVGFAAFVSPLLMEEVSTLVERRVELSVCTVSICKNFCVLCRLTRCGFGGLRLYPVVRPVDAADSTVYVCLWTSVLVILIHISSVADSEAPVGRIGVDGGAANA